MKNSHIKGLANEEKCIKGAEGSIQKGIEQSGDLGS
jgi:hypothetical protein